MNRPNLLSALLGGLVAVVIGAILIATGAVGSTETKTVVQPAPLSTRPVAAKSSGGLSVNDIYKQVGPGVAFIQAQIVEQTSNPFGFPEQQRGTATGSGFVLDKQGDIATNAHVIDGASKVQVAF